MQLKSYNRTNLANKWRISEWWADIGITVKFPIAVQFFIFKKGIKSI